MKTPALFLLLLLASLTTFGQPASTSPLHAFPLSAVRLLDSPFQQAQQTDLRYILAMNPDRLLAPYRREAGLTPKAEPYGNWENTGLDGHIGGHYLSALSLMYAATGHAEIGQRLAYMLDQLEQCQNQNGNGYLGGVPGGKAMWEQIAQGKIQAESFSLNGKWVPWYNLHKVYAGLRDAYQVAGQEKAKAMLIRLADWSLALTANLSDAQIQEMLKCEHGGMNEVFADVAALTGDPKYLALARRFSHQFILNPLLAGKDELNGLHANTQIPKVIGYKRVAEVGKDPAWATAADFFWKTVVDHRTVSIGGHGVREHFHPATDFSSMLESKEGPETCNSYNMLKLARQLYLTSGSTVYLDYYERATYNHILSSQHPQGGFVYFTPMRPRHYRVYSQPDQGFWCCVGSGLENHGKYGELIYAHTDQALLVNLFVASELRWKEKGLTLTQQTRFPYEESTQLTLTLTKPQRLALQIRHPEWIGTKGSQIQVNGKAVKTTESMPGYATVDRTWKTGDVVTVALPMQNRTEYLPDHSSWVSFVHGPIVLAAATDTSDLVGLKADASRSAHIAQGKNYPVEEAPVLLAANTNKVDATALKPVPGQPLTFTIAQRIVPSSYQNLTLVPFYQLHDARYMLYWPVSTPEQLEARKKALQAAEEAKQALEAQTLDQVTPGEQQPESDHHYQSELSESGVHQDRPWRHAKGWLSYDLKSRGQKARTLRITYFGLDSGRHFDIYANGALLASVHSTGSQGNAFFDVDYPLPEQVLRQSANGIVTVKFVAHEGSIAGGIYGVRLLK